MSAKYEYNNSMQKDISNPKDDVDIHYDITFGDKTKPMIVLLHGLGGDLTAWDKERKIFTKLHYSSLAVDLRGHGKSGRPSHEDGYNFKKIAEDVFFVLKHESIMQPILVGHCLGGMIAMVIEASHPHTAKALVLVDTSYKPPIFGQVMANHIFLQKIAHILAKYLPLSYIEKRAEYEKFLNTSDYDMQRIFSDITHTSLKSYLMLSKHITNFNGIDLLKKIQIPTLVIEGLNDTVFPPDIAQELHARIKHSTIEFVPNANQILVLTSPTELTATIDRFIENLA